MKYTKFLQVFVLVAGLLIFSAMTFADTCSISSVNNAADLTNPGASCTDSYGAVYTNVNPSPTGTGNIDPFVKMQGNDPTIDAYNTTADVSPPFYQNGGDNWNHQVQLSNLIPVNVNGTLYYDFSLDIDQTKDSPFLSLDEVQIFQSTDPNQAVTTFNSGVLALNNATLVYRLDTGSNNFDEVVLNYALNSGSGSGDLDLLIPVSAFNGTGDYVYLYSHFGGLGSNCGGVTYTAPVSSNGDTKTSGDCTENDGPEEWYTIAGVTEVPEPATLTLLGTGLLGLGAKLRRRTKKKS